MPSATCRASSVVFRAIATDSLAAASQLLADVQRFGLQMVEFRMMVDVEGGAAIDFGIDASPDRDPAVLCSRFARHPALRSVEIVGRSPVKVEGAMLEDIGAHPTRSEAIHVAAPGALGCGLHF